MTHWERSLGAAFAGALLLVAPACSSKDVAKPKPPQLPAGAIILPAKDIAELLAQCSRASPEPGQGSWQPQVHDILKLEASLPATLRQREPKQNWSNFPTRWIRQYVGIVRDGRHYLYGSFVRAYPDAQMTEPVKVCDGGPAYFGAEYDVETGRISHLAFNGMA